MLTGWRVVPRASRSAFIAKHSAITFGGMDVSLPLLAIIFIVVLAGDAVACAIPIAYIKNDLDRLGCSPALQRLIPVLKFGAVAGLIVGLWKPALGVATCIALLLYFAVAFVFHKRANDTVAQYVPAAAVSILIVAVMVLSYLPGV